MRTISGTIIIIILCVTGCSDQEEDALPSGLLWPFAVGNHWEYRYERYEADSLVSRSETRIQIDSSFSARENRWFYLSRLFFFPMDREKILMRSDARGVWWLLLDSERNPVLIVWAFRLNGPPDPWVWFEMSDSTHLVSNDIEVTVPAGNYRHCLQFRHEWDRSTQVYDDFFFQPGIGLVKWSIISEYQPGKFSRSYYELTSFTLIPDSAGI